MATSKTGAARIELDQFTQLAFEAVLRAGAARKLPPSKIPGPIIFGIIWWPEGMPAPGVGVEAPRIEK